MAYTTDFNTLQRREVGRLTTPEPLLDSTVTTAEYSRYKIIKTGKLLEVYQAQFPFRVGEKIEQFNHPIRNRTLEYKNRALIRARNKIRRLVQTNFDKSSKFITLTFRNTPDLDVTDLSSCYQEFKLFIMRLRYKYPNIKYVAVPEYQTKNDRGAVHFHIICNLPFVKASILADIWGLGFVKINRIDYSKKVGAYISKYLSKTSNQRLATHKMYYRSTNLSKPQVFYGSRAMLFCNVLFNNHISNLEYQTTYDSEFNGKITYTEFNFYEGG